MTKRYNIFEDGDHYAVTTWVNGRKVSAWSYLFVSCFILFGFVLSACGTELRAAMAEVPSKHNVLFILVDDLGWRDVGYAGSTFNETPNIDSLASEGTVFTNAYASAPICSPTRAALMTGKHPARLNITNWIPGQRPEGKLLLEPEIRPALSLEEQTLPERLQMLGYQTFFAGKWHLGGEGFHPDDQGFATNKGGHHRGQPPKGYYSPYGIPKLEDGPAGEYLPDRLTEETVKFIKDNKNKPFFAYLSYYTVHTPIQAAVDHIDTFQAKANALAPSSLPKTQEERTGITKVVQDNATYASMVAAMDVNIGRLLSALKELELDRNTLVIFTSDNGGLSTLDPNHSIFEKGIPTSNAPLRAGKGWLYEGGIRVPLIIRAPSATAGQVAVPVLSTDLFYTVLDWAGLNKETGPDGVSLFPLLHGEPTSTLDRPLFWHFPHYHGSASVPSSAIREGDWKFIRFYEDGASELYNIADDPGELRNLAGEEEDQASSLKVKLERALQQTNAQMPENSQ